MKKLIISIIVLIAAFTTIARAEDKPADKKQVSSEKDSAAGDFTYIIGPADVLQISVWKHPDLTTQVTVRPDGKIAFPLVDELDASNASPSALKKEIAGRLSAIINNPQVTVNVIDFQSKKFFVVGEVDKPGVYPFEGNEGVFEAISKAGGYKEATAALKSVMLIKRGYTSKPRALRANIYNLITNADMSQDLKLEDGDIVFVPKTFIANVDTFIEQFFSKTEPVLKYYLSLYAAKHPSRLLIAE